MAKQTKKTLDLASILMGGPNGRGAPLSPEALGMMDARGFPVVSNDGRNLTYSEPSRIREREEQSRMQLEAFFAPILQDVGRQLFAPPPPREPEGFVESLLTPILKAYVDQQIQGLREQAEALPSEPLEPLTKFDDTPAGKSLAFLKGLFAGNPAQAERKNPWTP